MRRFWIAAVIAAGVLAAVFLAGLRIPEVVTVPETQPVTVPEPPETVAETTEATLPPQTLPPETVPPETLPEPVSYDYVPLYFQTDYPDVAFGKGTIATSGCSITCLAMVATYLTDREYTPPQLAHHFGSYGETNIDRLNYGIEQMQLPCRYTFDADETLQAVREGKVAIALMGETSIFTTSQHFIAIVGMGEYGKFLVNDPMEANYTAGSRHMKESLATGFSHIDLRTGFSGAWIFDKEAMPSEPVDWEAAQPKPRTSRYEGYILTEEDIYTLACFSWAEARDQEPAVRQAVVEVVLNRILSDAYPGSVQEILTDTELSRALEMMSWVEEPELEFYLAVDAAMYGPYILPQDICFYSEWEKGQDIWGQLGKYIFARKR
jgi:hypothetical protein